MPNVPTREPNISKPIQPKQIVITESEAITKEDELTLKVAFKLFPSKAAFSKIKSDLWFENQLIKSALVRIPQGPMNGEAFELTPILNMKGIATGTYSIRFEMYELWSDGEKLSFTSKEMFVEYIPKTRASRLIKIPIVKSFGGADLAVVSESDKKHLPRN